MELFFEILVCALAAFGLWCALRLLTESFFLSRQIAPSVAVCTAADVNNICALLGEARATLSCRRGGHIIVLCDATLTERGQPPAALAAACRRHGAICLVTDLSETRKQFNQHTK